MLQYSLFIDMYLILNNIYIIFFFVQGPHLKTLAPGPQNVLIRA